MAGKPTYTAAELSRRIEIYLSMHPNAADTLEGITRWWLKDVPGIISPEDVLTALKLLEVQGAIKTYSAPGGERIYANKNCTRH